jgi:hypothetical protein
LSFRSEAEKSAVAVAFAVLVVIPEGDLLLPVLLFVISQRSGEICCGLCLCFSCCHPRRGSAVVLAVGIRAGLQSRVKAATQRPPHCPEQRRRLERSPKGEAPDLLLLFLPLHLFFSFSAQKTHVKPPNLSKTRQPTHNKPNIFPAKLGI